MRAFAQAERFVSEVEGRKLRPAYVFVGDEAFFRKKCREAILQYLVPADMREFGFFEFDLAETLIDRTRQGVVGGCVAIRGSRDLGDRRRWLMTQRPRPCMGAAYSDRFAQT